MRRSVPSSGSRLIVKLAAASALALAAAGCSMGTERFASSGPFANPFGSDSRQGPVETGSIDGPAPAAPAGTVSSAPLAPPSAQPAPSSTATYQPTYVPPYREPPRTASVTPLPSAGGPVGWSADGGSMIVVRGDDTVRTLAERYGVPEDAIRSVNHLSRAAALHSGQRLIIPVYRSAGVPSAPSRMPGPRTASLASPTPPRPMPVAAPGWVVGPQPAGSRTREANGQSGVHVVRDGDTLFSVARETHVDVHALAAANHVGLDHHVRIGERLVIPGRSATMASAKPVPVPPAEPPHRAEPPAPPPATKSPTHITTTLAAEPAAATQPPHAPERTASISNDDGKITFRWPVQGRVIAGFGHEPNGTTNDGINLAVPEGAPVQAAADGVVAYAGNELKGYGNLVLIRHRDGWVTAYAHNSKILVKKGETVRRGQVIARAGATGSVDSPQLHFELRHGATPVNPLKYLPSGQG